MCRKLILLTSFVLVLALAGFAQAEILLNPGFEDGPDSWITWGSGSGSGAGGYWWSSAYGATVIEDGTAQSGNSYIEIGFWPPDGPWWGYCYAWQEHPVTEGKTYQSSAWIRAGDADGAATLIVEGATLTWEWRSEAPVEVSSTAGRGPLLDIDGDGIGDNNDKIHHRFDLTEEWTYLSVVEVAPPGAKGLSVIFGTPTSFVNIDIDNASFIELGAKALYPDPPDGRTDVRRLPVLGWTPGKFAAPTNGHKVYFSENFNDVNDGIGGVTQDANSYAPGQRLDFGTTYYWRVDEVNNVNPESPWIGNVWSFTTEPFAYPVENITATASSIRQADMGPENTINSSGLDVNDLHSTETTAMWLSDSEPNGAWIEYELDKVYKLHEMWVWNSNDNMEAFVGFGFKDVTIEYSVDGNDYTILGATHEFVQAPGTPGYAHNTTVDFGGAAAKYVKLTANSHWGGTDRYGLSEVSFSYIPLRAREPQPESGATDMAVDLVLSFRAGREAAEHNVYISTDEQAVIDSNVPVSIVTEAQDGPKSLDLGETYYWKVNEVNMAETSTMLQGDIWNFTTSDSLVGEDFESYNDIPAGEEGSNLVYSTWIDGYENPLVNGATIGYVEAYQPSMETGTVHDGDQSVPFSYDNSTAGYSEATANIANLAIGGNWALHGIESLSLWFYGDPNNTPEQMYVELDGVKVLYDGDAGNITKSLWQPWNINMADFAGVDLSNVNELSIGFERIGLFGGSGTVLFDDIRLYPYSRQLITPVEPDPANLVVSYSFENNTQDGSGNGLNGTIMGNPVFVGGIAGMALSFDGLNDYVDFGNNAAFDITEQITLSAWVNPNDAGNGEHNPYVGKGDNAYAIKHASSNTIEFFIYDGGWNVAQVKVDDSFNGEWHHVAGTYDGNELKTYVDGILGATVAHVGLIEVQTHNLTIGNNSQVSGRYYDGAIDEVNIFNRVLSYAEVAWLAGRTLPFDKPF